eukprot:CAMPEP_0176055404 /NCGR_PEP_ID=MMETSP0120_2-20121206/27583_1 /TAXON_ID=160619 /ORGANISM="Kryptoperidinium foliaceum, Strain CCMP 1326" /LENGTH=467 /DNA_ID=CAMNT_0017388899 /DNA_START=129 /DNA_END=1532 /DNA_ORIENTATION=+
MKFSKAAAFALTLAGASAFAPVYKPAAKAVSTSSLNGIFYLDDVYVPTESPEDLPPGAIPAMTPPCEISEGQVRALFYLWNDALATGDSRIVAKRYSEDPLLLPTVSDVPRTDYDTIKDYFDNFLKLEPQGVILDGHITIGNGWARDAGIYEFTMGVDGSKVKARYTYVYVYENGQWKISHHHSSVMPEASNSAGPGTQVTEDQIRNLFYLWNDALDTLDSDVVAKRYSKEAVLLPTVSDTPRTDYDSIKDYFDNFLKLKPQGEILDSFVTVGDGWAKDVGIYEFTMGTTGDKVKARYSFVYVYEDGAWKIAHHHSSAMPEASKGGPKISEDECKNLFYLWNDALATLDPDAVARRYASNAVLLPTVSDIPRTDYDSIRAYFVDFLQKKPQGVILESYATCGEGWCKDVGIYEFTMGATGDKVKARYSYVYVYEGGEWKIAHHHSSVMPEALLAAASTPNGAETVEA